MTPDQRLTISPGAQKAPTGTKLYCKDWHAEAALRMFLNNLDAEVAERPDPVTAHSGGTETESHVPRLST